MKMCLLYSLMSALLFGCASLTKTQLTAVNQFAKTSENFSAYPSKIMVELAEVRVKRGIFFANSLDDPKLHVGELDSIYTARKEDLQLSAKADITFRIIDKYAQSLLVLSADKYTRNLTTQAETFGENLDSLITLYNSMGDVQKVPAGIGATAAEWITAGGRLYLHSKQAREVKKFVTLADTLISVMCSNLTTYLTSSNLQELIDNEEKGVSSNYLSYLRQKGTVTNARGSHDTLRLISDTKSTLENDRDYVALRTSVDAVRNLRDETVEATAKLRLAHGKVKEAISTRKTLKSTLAEVQELYAEIRKLKIKIALLDNLKK